jgi:hypothetical protein
MVISIVAAAVIVRLMLSLMPANICRGKRALTGARDQQRDDDLVE